MKKELTDKVRVSHVLDAITEIEKYLHSVSYDDFLANSEKRFTTIKQIEIIDCRRDWSGRARDDGFDWTCSMHQHFLNHEVPRPITRIK